MSTPSLFTAGSGERQSLIGAIIRDKNGQEGKVISVIHEGDAVLAQVELDNDEITMVTLASLELESDVFRVPYAFEESHQIQGKKMEQTIAIPIIEEEIKINKHSVDTGKGVRVIKQVKEHEEQVDVPLMHQTVSVEEVEIGTFVSPDKLPVARMEGDTYVVPVLEEVLVVEKRIRLKEVRITHQKHEEHQRQTITLRTEHVSVERFDDHSPSTRKDSS